MGSAGGRMRHTSGELPSDAKNPDGGRDSPRYPEDAESGTSLRVLLWPNELLLGDGRSDDLCEVDRYSCGSGNGIGILAIEGS